MKLNLSKPLVKYLVIASSAFIVFLLIYTYVKFTNDRVYELAKEQVVESDVKPESIKEALNIEPMPPQSQPSASNAQTEAKSLSNSETFRIETKGVENQANGKILITGKSAHTCMRELNTSVINNDVVKCTHDHYVKPY